MFKRESSDSLAYKNFEREVINMSKLNPYSNAGYVGYGMYAQPNEEVAVTKAVCTTMLIVWGVITLITTGMMVATDEMMWCIVASMCSAGTIWSAIIFKGFVNAAKDRARTAAMPILSPMSKAD